MPSLVLGLTCLLLLSMATACYSQGNAGTVQRYRKQEKLVIPGIRSVYVKSDSDFIVLGLCKNYSLTLPRTSVPSNVSFPQATGRNIPFLTVHGNVLYDFVYRSMVDTPFYQKDLQQHTIQTSLSISIKNRYPFKVTFSNRRGNSPFFRNFLDVNLGFDKAGFVKNVKQELLERIANQALRRPDLVAMEEELKELTGQYRAIKNQLSAPDLVGQLLEERERSFAPSKTIAEQQQQAQFINWNQRLMHKKPSGVFDTLQATQSKVAHFVDEQTKKLAELEREIQRLEQKKGSLQKEVLQQLNATKQKINKASNRELKKWMKENHMTQDRLEGFLAGVKTLGIGRSMVNYSELTAWNVMLTGVNVEYNPTYYAAFAAGKIDFGFRDFLGRYKTNRAQNMILGRFGIGDREQKALIFSVFAGTKNNYGAAPTDTVTHQVHLVGYSLEGIWRKDPNTGLVAEIAKTTEPVTGLLRKNSGLQNLWEFSNTANLAISLKGETLLKNTRTRISGVFKKTGATFQSFGLFTYQADQVSWNIKVDQPFWRDKISLVAMLRRNDFTNPFTVKTFKSSTVFKSFQASIRLPKWPVVSAGYYPGTQLYMIDKEHIRENAYYIINASLLHSYSLRGARMVSSVIYNGYASKGADSGFIAYAGKNYIATHYVTWRKVQLQGCYSFTDQERMQFSTGEGGVDYSVSGKLRVGGGVRYNHILKGTDYWGSRLQLHVTVGHLGELHLQYEKSFLPTIHRSLYPVEIGRVSWSKFF